MSTIDHCSGNGQGLPDEVKHLIERELSRRRRQLENEWNDAKLGAFSQLQADIRASIEARRPAAVFGPAALPAYQLLVANVAAITRGWPKIVWEVIQSIVDQVPAVSVDHQTLNTIIDERAWAIDQHPFTLDYVDVERFKERVVGEAKRYALAPKKASFRLLNLEGAAWHVGIINIAREARVTTGIAIDEYLLTRRLLYTPAILDVANEQVETPETVNGLEIGSPQWREQTARKAANARHDKPGGSRDKQQQMREIWASGRYSTRDRCAEEECEALEMSFAAARKALRNTPDP